MLKRSLNTSFVLNSICLVATATSSLYFHANLRGCNFLYISAALHSELADATGEAADVETVAENDQWVSFARGGTAGLR